MSAFSEDKVPTAFLNEIERRNDPNIIILRSSVKNLSDCNEWVKEFGLLTNTSWLTRSSKPTAERMVCMKRFVCHQSAFNKLAPETSKRSFSKNSGCSASIKISVKRSTKNTKIADPFVKKGLPAVVRIRDEHNHSLDTAETLRCLPAAVCKEKFIEYFNNGMKVSKALKHHRELLKLRDDISEKDMTNSRINPTNRTVQHWFMKWRLQKLNPKQTKIGDISKVDFNIVEQQGDEKGKQLGNVTDLLGENIQQLAGKAKPSEYGKDFNSSKDELCMKTQENIKDTPNQQLKKIQTTQRPSKRKHWITEHWILVEKRKLLKNTEPTTNLPAYSPSAVNKIKEKTEDTFHKVDQAINRQDVLNTIHLRQPTVDPNIQANSPSPVIKIKEKTEDVFNKVDQAINRQDILNILYLPPPTADPPLVIIIKDKAEDIFRKVDQATDRHDIPKTLYLPPATVEPNLRLQANSLSPVIKIKDVCKVDQAINKQDILNILYLPPATVDSNLRANSPSPVIIIKEEIEIEDVCQVDQAINRQDILKTLYLPPTTVDLNLPTKQSIRYISSR